MAEAGDSIPKDSQGFKNLEGLVEVNVSGLLAPVKRALLLSTVGASVFAFCHRMNSTAVTRNVLETRWIWLNPFERVSHTRPRIHSGAHDDAGHGQKRRRLHDLKT